MAQVISRTKEIECKNCKEQSLIDVSVAGNGFHKHSQIRHMGETETWQDKIACKNCGHTFLPHSSNKNCGYTVIDSCVDELELADLEEKEREKLE